MTTVSMHQGSWPTGVTRWIESVRQILANRKSAAESYAALSHQPDTALADLGLVRSDIRAHALRALRD